MEFTLEIEPFSFQFSGKRVMVRGGRPVFYKDNRAVKWQRAVALLASKHRPVVPFEGPLEMEVTFVIQRPKVLLGKKHPDERIWNICRPDCDNLQKGLQDSLVGFWLDDAQIVKLNVFKVYSAKNEKPKIELKINKL